MQIQLDAALRQFAVVFARARLNDGQVSYRQPVSVATPVKLGPVLTEYFSKLSLVDRPQLGGAFQMALFSPEELEGAQSGWRFVRDRGGRVIEDADWASNWVVIADRNGDAIFVDTATADGTTYGSIQKRNLRLSGSLATFLACLSSCMEVEVDQFDYEVKDDDFNLLDSFTAEIGNVIRQYLNADEEAAFMRFFFG